MCWTSKPSTTLAVMCAGPICKVPSPLLCLLNFYANSHFGDLWLYCLGYLYRVLSHLICLLDFMESDSSVVMFAVLLYRVIPLFCSGY